MARVQEIFEDIRDAVIPEITRMEQQGKSKEEVLNFAQNFTDEWLLDWEKNAILSGQPLLSAADQEQVRFRLKELLGAGALEGLLSIVDVENIHIFGSHKAVLTYIDGRKEEIGPITESDETLVELVRHLASMGSRTSRRFDRSSPILDLRLPTGHRLLAIMEVSSRPAPQHICHRCDIFHETLGAPAGHEQRISKIISQLRIVRHAGNDIQSCLLFKLVLIKIWIANSNDAEGIRQHRLQAIGLSSRASAFRHRICVYP